MAKVISLQGKARGKIGGIVYRVEAGIGMIASEYNPSPRNPRTLAQTVQRNKMNLAGQLSSMLPYAVIAGMGRSRREARASFISNLLRVSTSQSTTAGTIRAQIDFNQLLISRGIQVPLETSIAAGTAEGSVVMRVPAPSATENILGYIYVFITTSEDGFKSVEYGTIENNTSEVTYNAPAAIVASGATIGVNGFIVPIVNTGDASRASYERMIIAWEGGSGYAYTEAVRSLVSSEAYAQSQFVGGVTIGG